jgi:transposase-like protein
MDGKVLGVERRRRWNKEEKARIVEETLMPDAVVCEVARRHGVAQSRAEQSRAEPTLYLAKAGAGGGTQWERRLDFAPS